ncbi:TlpA family protein disulfide reductase [Brachybacterium fresconis]|uniref:Methylamine utilisation protein MauE domain-containing protein n=1 Tax=Brachybacterium fresconis TaxID=173363 RepID=A0ABS4YM78_9MICO|nr:MauE/DoxX family redox-associated membrane protein [Brachybacterium fresconis]MBP2409899.1 hypothetical protein [Brachybacterium fresconis]
MSVLIAAPILLTLTLLFSGLAKLGARQGTEDAMTSLRLPLRPLHPVIASVLPAAEIVLALVVWVPLVPLQVVVTVLTAALMFGYLGIIARALTWEEAVECSCFGTLASPTVSRTTLARNILLSILAVLGVLAAGSGQMTLALVQHPLTLVTYGGVLLVTVALTALAIGTSSAASTASTSATAGAPSTSSATASGPVATTPGSSADVEELEGEEEILDYERTAIPAGVLQRPGGTLVTLRQLSAQQAVLLVFVSEGCGPCERVLDEVPAWIEELSGFLQVRPVLSRPLDQLRERTLDRVGAHALHDLQFSAREALGGRGAPAAVLLGADGLLAGGPVSGGSAVIEFVEDIRTELRSAQEDGELPTPAE